MSSIKHVALFGLFLVWVSKVGTGCPAGSAGGCKEHSFLQVRGLWDFLPRLGLGESVRTGKGSGHLGGMTQASRPGKGVAFPGPGFLGPGAIHLMAAGGHSAIRMQATT